VHDWADFPSELLLTLKDPLLPPGLLLELSGTWNNPCRSVIPPRDDAHWEPYKDQWCAAKLAAYSYNFVPCNIWGEFPAQEVRRQSGKTFDFCGRASGRFQRCVRPAFAGASPF